MNANDNTTNNTTDSKHHLQALVSDFDIAMLVTHTLDGMHARPMAIACLNDGVDAYLVTHINSIKVDEISANPLALLTFQSAKQFASVRGDIAVMQDRHLLDKMWKDVWKVWFPLGKSDPNIALLKFTAHTGEYWDNAGLQGLKYIYKAAKAYITGKGMGGAPQSAGNAQHAKVRL
jgi:general stress protein 26